MSVVAARPVNVLSGGAGASTIFRDSFNRASSILGPNWVIASKPNTAAAGNVVTATAFLGAASAGNQCGAGLASVFRWSHTAPTFNPNFSWPAWALPLPTATTTINGRSQFAAVKLCVTSRVGVSGDFFAGPAVFIDMSTAFATAGTGYALNVQATTHNWFLDKVGVATLATGGGIVDGDVLSIELTTGVGSVTLVARRNSTILSTQVDNTPLTTGYPGMACQAIQQSPGVLISDWANYIGGLGPLQTF